MIGWGRYGLLPSSGGGSGTATAIEDPDEVLTIGQFTDGLPVARDGTELTSMSAADLAALVEPELDIVPDPFIDRIVVAGSAQQTRTFGASGHGINQAAISDGHVYQIIGICIPPAGSTNYTLRPNAEAPSGTKHDVEVWGLNNGAESLAQIADLRLAGAIASASYILFDAWFSRRAGLPAVFSSIARYVVSGAVSWVQQFHGAWISTGDALSSLDIRSNDAAGLGIGSVLSLYDRGAI
jgi:hypothetical protein